MRAQCLAQYRTYGKRSINESRRNDFSGRESPHPTPRDFFPNPGCWDEGVGLSLNEERRITLICEYGQRPARSHCWARAGLRQGLAWPEVRVMHFYRKASVTPEPVLAASSLGPGAPRSAMRDAL